MADKKNKNIYVEQDYENIFIIDPNSVQNEDGNREDRYVNQQSLIMYANLTCKLTPRSKLVFGVANNSVQSETVMIGEINFLKPGGREFLENNYISELLGTDKLANSARTAKYARESGQSFGQYQDNLRNDGAIVDNGFLGISNIQIRTNAAHTPTVTITLIDVRGSAMFEQGNNSPYAAFFSLPYPIFYLTIKGYYGKAVKYPLLLQKFNSSYDSSTGNFIVSLTFITFKYGPFGEINLGYALALPHMYNNKFDVTTQTNTSNSIPTNVTSEVNASKGFQRMVQLYDYYRNTNVLPADFPNITIQELIYKLDVFIKFTLSKEGQVNFQPLTDCDQFIKDVTDYQKSVFLTPGESWFATNIDDATYFVSEVGNLKYYTFKNTLDSRQKRVDAIENLKKIINDFNNKLKNNQTVQLTNRVIYSDFEIVFTKTDISLPKTFEARYKKPYPASGDTKLALDLEVISEIPAAKAMDVEGNITDVPRNYFIFEGPDRFMDITNKMKDYAIQVRKQKEQEFSEKLSELLKNPDTGIGFNPTIRNIIAVFVVSLEAFYSLLDDVHDKAWLQRDNPSRKNSNTEPDWKCYGSGRPESESLVYPWPMFTVENTDLSGNTKYEIAYPGDEKYQTQIKSYDYEIWPEVEFVEEYARAFALRDSVPQTFVANQKENQDVNRISLTTYEVPISNSIFADKQESKFFYEIIERIILQTYYQGFDRSNGKKTQIINFLAETIAINIQNSVGVSNPYLLELLTNFKFNAATYTDFLKSISNQGVGESWNLYIRDNFATKNIRDIINTPTSIIWDYATTISTPKASYKDNLNVLDFISGNTHTDLYITDFPPYTDESWLTDNLANGNSVTNYNIFNKTSNSLFYNDVIKTITNYTSNTDINNNKPFTNFNIRELQQPATSTFSTQWYTSQIQDKKQFSTVAKVKYDSYENLLSSEQLTSIFNTPFFINSIIDGVSLQKQNSSYPYVASAYLLLNSLPLATLREKYIKYNTENGQSDANQNYTELDFIASTLRKFGGVHKLPYAWILKYGSIWHRYKKYIETGEDIISSCWSAFNKDLNYDPLNQSPETTYTLTGTTFGTKTITLNEIVPQDAPSTFYNNYISLGFYPRVVNEFCYFYNGLNFYTDYSNINEETSDKINGNLIKIYSPSSSKLTSNNSTYDPNLLLSIDTYSCLVRDVNNANTSFFILPSFGSNINQLKYEFFDSTNNLQKNYNVEGTYNGSIRMDWANPHYGYFDPSNIIQPNHNEYLKKVFDNTAEQDDFSFISQNGYSSIEDIFGVFSKDELDIFENEFLKFSKSEINYEQKDGDIIPSTYLNFQKLMKKIFSVQNLNEINPYNAIQNIQQTVFQSKNSILSSFLNQDLVLKRANPYSYDRRTYDSFLYNTTKTKPILDPIDFGNYLANTPNALPSSANTVTLSNVITNYPNEWNTLNTYVGFSNIPKLKYENSGSTYFDFFIEFNIPFTVENIKILTPIIKQYGSYKINNQDKTSNDFINDFIAVQTNRTSLRNNVLDNTFQTLSKTLPKVKSVNSNSINSVMVGDTMKVEYYDLFKTLNDKWVAGNNFGSERFLNDFLFLDKASRDVGDLILVDVFKVKNKIKNADPATNVYTIIREILADHHFVSFTMPGYINFYNIKEGPNETANFMFGTYQEVDYSQSDTKFVNILSTEPSVNTLIETKSNGFCDDAWRFDRPNKNPTVRLNSSDAQKSNKVVGFAVDFGLQRQSIFHNLNLAQDIGKATSESLRMEFELSQLTNGRKSQSQSVSLYNLYKNRSYSCTVQGMGNAIIQPTMYFSLRNVPMFNGPYLILEVNHSISPGSFETTFTGIRQKIYTLPQQDELIQSIKLQISKDYYNTIKNQKPSNNQESPTTPQTGNTITQTEEVNNQVNNTATNNDGQTCTENVLARYASTYIATKPNKNVMSYNQMISNIKDYNSDIKVISTVFSICMILNDTNSNLVYYNNNPGNVSLEFNWNGSLETTYFLKEYSCLTVGNKQIPIVNFTNNDSSIKFMVDYLKNWINSEITSTVKDEMINQITNFFIKHWQILQTDAFVGNYKVKNPNEYQTIVNKVTKSVNTILSSGLVELQSNEPPVISNNQNLSSSATTQIISATTTTISGTLTFVITINDPSGGLWRIFGFDERQIEPADCVESVGNNLSNYIIDNGQKVQISIEDILLEGNQSEGCAVNGAKYEFECSLQPILPDGSLDNSRTQKFQKVYYTINL